MRPALPLLAIALLAAACGRADHGGDDAPAPDDRQQADGADPAQGPTDEPPTTPVPYSMALAGASSLPTCDAAHDLQLVYLLAEKQFQTCQDGKWSVVMVEAPADPGPTLQEVKNLLATIELGDKLTDLLPEVRAVLLGPLAKSSKAPTDACVPALDGESYDVILDDYSYGVVFRAGVADVICDDAVDGGTCRVLGCANR